MKLTLGVLLCLGTALAYFPRIPETLTGEELELGQIIEDEKEFRYGRELKYIYNGQSMTGIPGTSKQHAGSRIQAKITVVCKHQQTCVMKIDEVRIAKLNRDVKTPRHVLPMTAFDPIVLEPKQRQKLHLPIKFSISSGIINNIVFDGLEKPWSANIKRGILNMIQVNLQKPKPKTDIDIVDAVEEQMLNTYKPTETDARFYRTMEETIEGECETIYTVTKPPLFKSSLQPIFNVTKTVNFEKCIKRPQIKYNFHFSDPCPTSEDSKYNEDQKFLKSSSITSYQVVKTPKFNIVSNARTESEYIFVPFNEEANAVVTYVSQNLKLIKAGRAWRRIPVPMNPIKSDSDMIYSLDHEVAQELFQMEGDASSLEEIVYRKHQNKVQLAINLLRKLVNNIREQVHEPATKYFVKLVSLFRILSKDQIEKVHYAVMEGAGTPQYTHHERKIARDLLHDALATAGTKPAVKHIVHKIKRREIPIHKSISAISNLKTIPIPSKEIIEELISLAESQVAHRHYLLKQVTWLTIGTLMKGLCSNDVDQWARDQKETLEKICPKNLKEQYVKTLMRKLHSSHQWDDQLIYVKALGNAGLDMSIFDIEKIIYNKNFNYHTLIRAEAILALRNLKSFMPKKVQKVLMPIVSNPMQPENLRITAVYMILQTMPSRPLLDQLAKVAQNEHNIQVASFIDSYMHSMANSTNPCEKKFATDLKLSLRQMHKVYARPLGTSKFWRLPLQSEYQKVGLDLDLTSTFTDRLPIPRHLTASLHSNFLGLWHKYLVSLRLSTEGLEKAFRKTYGHLSPFGLSGLTLQEDYENMVTSFNAFEEERRDPMSSEPKAVLNLKVKNQDTFFLPFKRSTVMSLLMAGLPTGQGIYLEEKLRQGLLINHNKAGMVDEIRFNVPTTLGLPLLLHVKVPYVANVHGAVKMTPSLAGSLTAFQIKAALKPSFVTSFTVDIKTWSPMVSSGVSVVNKVKAFQPIDAKLLVDLKGETKITKLLFKPPTQRKDLLTLESKPFTFADTQPSQPQSYHDKQKRLILGEEGNRVRKIHECGTCTFLGTKFCIKGHYHKTPEHRWTEASFVPLSGPNKIVISSQPSYNSPRIVAINLYSKFLKPIAPESFSYGLFKSPVFSDRERFLRLVGVPLMDEMRTEPLYDDLMAETALINNYPTRNPQYRHSNVKRPVANSLRLEVEANERRLTADLLHVFNFDGDYHKVQAKVVKRSAERPEPWKMCLNSEVVLPTKAMIRQLADREITGKLLLNWGASCQSPNFIHIIKRIEKGQRSKMHELQNPEWRIHRDANMKYDELLRRSPIKYIFDVKYNNVPLKTKHYANEFLRYVKKRYYDQTNVAEVAVYNRPQHIKVIVAIDPVTLKKCDVLIKTPKSDVLIRDMPMPLFTTPITHKRDYVKNDKKHLGRESRMIQSPAQCYATEYKLKTFKDKELPLPLSSSYKVLAKDCGSNRYTVLVRQLPEYRLLKEVKIISPMNQIVLKPSVTRPSKTKVYVNGRDYTLQDNVVKTEAGLPILKIVKQDSYVKVELLDSAVNVYFDRKSVNVEVPHYKRHSQCGLCGSQKYDDVLDSFSSIPLSAAFEKDIFTEDIMRNQEPFAFERDIVAGDVMRYQEPFQFERDIYDKDVLRYQEPFEFEKDFLAEDILRNRQPFESDIDILSDFTTPENTLQYYFGRGPAKSILRKMLTEEIFDTPYLSRNMPGYFSEMGEYEFLSRDTPGYFSGIDEYERFYQNTPEYFNKIDDLEYSFEPNMRRESGRFDEFAQGWSKPLERLWEIDQVSSDNELRELDVFNSEFNTFYTPADTLERNIEKELFDESITSTYPIYPLENYPFDRRTSPFVSYLPEEFEIEREELIRNPYLANNYLIDQDSCSYMPFWQRQKSPACQDMFATAFEMERGFGFDESEYEMENVLNELIDTPKYSSWSKFEDDSIFDEVELDVDPFRRPRMTREIRDQMILDDVTEDGRGEMISREFLNEAEKTEFSGRQQKVVETEHTVCFSKIPSRCTENYYPTREVQKRVPYHCISRKDHRANKYLNEILSGRKFIPQIVSRPTTMTRIEVVPVHCKLAY